MCQNRILLLCIYCDLRKLHLTRKQRKVRVRAETKKTRHLRHHQQHQAIKVPSATSVTSEGISLRTAPIKLSGDRRLVSIGIVRLTCMACSVISGQLSMPSVGQNEGHESRATQSGKCYSGSAGFQSHFSFCKVLKMVRTVMLFGGTATSWF